MSIKFLQSSHLSFWLMTWKKKIVACHSNDAWFLFASVVLIKAHIQGSCMQVTYIRLVSGSKQSFVSFNLPSSLPYMYFTHIYLFVQKVPCLVTFALRMKKGAIMPVVKCWFSLAIAQGYLSWLWQNSRTLLSFAFLCSLWSEMWALNQSQAKQRCETFWGLCCGLGLTSLLTEYNFLTHRSLAA